MMTRNPRRRAAGLSALLLGLPVLAQAQAPADPPAVLPDAPGDNLTMNFPGGIALDEFIRVAEIYTKKRFIFQDEAVKKKTIIIYGGQNPLPVKYFFDVFQTVLAMNKFTLTPIPYSDGRPGDEPLAYKIIQLQDATSQPTPVYDPEELEKLPFDDRWVSGIFSLKYIAPQEIAPTLVNFVSNPKGLIPLPSANMILVNDINMNVKRIEKILKIMDVKGPDIQMEVVKLKWAIATSLEPQLSRIVQTIMRTKTRAPTPGAPAGSETLEIVADQRTNSLIVVAEDKRIPEILSMIRKLDSGETTPAARTVHTYQLKNTNAGPVAEILNRVYQGMLGQQYGRYGGFGSYGSYGGYPGSYGAYGNVGTTAGAYSGYGSPYGGYGSYGGFGAGGFPGGEYPPTIVPDEQNNSIIVASDYYKFEDLKKIIRQLDVRRPQVLLEVAFVEISGSNTLDLGVELATIGRPGDSARGFAGSSFGLSRLVDTNADLIPDARIPTIGTGLTAGVFKQQIGNIPALLRVLESQGKLNVLQVPTAVTSDNQIAQLTISDEQPTATFVTGTTGNDSRTFRGYEKAGVTVKITPHISEERYLRLETEVSVADFAGASADPILPPAKTSRELKVAVSVPNEYTIVLGGLTKSAERDTTDGIPLLMDIPGLGGVFSHQVRDRQRSTLYVFITPHIFSDEEFSDFKRASVERQRQMEGLTGRWVGTTPREHGIPQYVPPFEIQNPFGKQNSDEQPRE